MTTVTPPSPCMLGLARADVAAWHDGALDAPAAEQLAAHVATCAACQAHLADFERAERLVRDERVPEPDPRLWEALRAASARRAARYARLPLGGLGAVAAVVLLALGFTFLFRMLGSRPVTTVAPTASATIAHPSPTASSTPPPTSTSPPVTKGTPLNWQAVSLPPGFTASHTLTNILTPSPADGRTAYACFFPQDAPDGAPPHLWATHDAAQTWTPLTVPAVGTVRSFELVADDRLPNTFAIGVSADAPPGPEDQFYITADGGATWHAIPHGLTIISLATYTAHGMSTTYAIVDTPTGIGTFTAQVQVSRNQLQSPEQFQTWQPLDIGAGAGETPMKLWMQPESGELLVETNSGSNSFALYASTSGGAQWRQVTSVTNGQLIVADPAPGEPYRVCRVAAAGDQGPTPLACNLNILLSDTFPALLDPRPALVADGVPTRSPLLVAIAGDGSLLALSPTTSGATTSYTLYRLPPDGASWQDIGIIPGFQLIDTNAADVERMWAMPENGIELDPQGRVFIARLQW